MHFSILATLVATVAASPIGAGLFERAGCSALGTTTVDGESVKGPFKLVSSGDFSKSGLYATFRRAGATVTYTTPPAREDTAKDFYLDGSGRLLSVDDGKYYAGYELQPNGAGAVKIGTATSSINMLKCSISSSCTMNCVVNGYSYDCLSSPGFEPDWRITKDSSTTGKNCIPFTPKVVPS